MRNRTLKIGILLGDDIGLEVVPESVKVMKAAAAKTGLTIEWHELPIGKAGHEQHGNTLPKITEETLHTLDGWIMGPIGHNAYPRGDMTWVMPPVRKKFDLFTALRPALSHPTIPSVHKNVDIAFFRELTEGMLYSETVVAGLPEFRPNDDITISSRVITRKGSNRVAREAFELARTRPRKKVTAAHKEPVYRLACGMFAEECRKVAKLYPDVQFEEMMIDSTAMKLVADPQRFDVVVTTNQFGDILTDIGAGLVGGLGLAPGLCIGEKQAMAQATHGSAPDIYGRNIANPYAMIMSGQMLMGWLGRKHKDAKASAAAELIQNAVTKVIAEGQETDTGPRRQRQHHADGRRHCRRAMMTRTTFPGGHHATHPDDIGGRARACLCPAHRLLIAQGWQPTRPIKMICPFPAGGGTDQIARIVAQQLTTRLGQQVYVENRGGANGGLGAQEVMRAEPDGYTIGAISDSPMTVNPWMYEKLAYRPLQDFIAVARINHFPSLLVAHPSTGIKTVAELIKVAKEKPGTLNYSSGGVGNFSHLGLAVLAFKTGINIVHVPYRGVGPATQAIVAGDVQLMYNNIATALPHVEAGKLTGIAVGGEQRFPALANVPTIAETVPGFDVTPWVGMFVPAKTPKEVVARLSKEVEALLKDPEVMKIFQANMIKASYLDSEPFTRQIEKETDDWEKVIKSLNIKAD